MFWSATIYSQQICQSFANQDALATSTQTVQIFTHVHSLNVVCFVKQVDDYIKLFFVISTELILTLLRIYFLLPVYLKLP